MLSCRSLLTLFLLTARTTPQVTQADPMDDQDDLTHSFTKQKRSLHVEMLPSAPVLSEAWQEVDDPEFLLVREAPDKRSRSKRSPLSMERMREHLMKRDPGYVAWASVTNNMDVLRGHLKEKLFVEVARRQGGGLGNIGKK